MGHDLDVAGDRMAVRGFDPLDGALIVGVGDHFVFAPIGK